MQAGSTLEGSIEPGEIIAERYRIVRLIGRGGMGAVYEAEHVLLGRLVALKLLLPSSAEDSEASARFMREARAAASIGHPGIVEVFDLGQHGNRIFLAMEKLEGEELTQRLGRRGQMSGPEAVRILIELAEAISAAHERRIVHRDLKPQNVFLARRGRESEIVKVLDFGIAKLMVEEPGHTITRTGQTLGTPLYMAPEQLMAAKTVDHRADIYAMGVILYELLRGRPPFWGESYSELIVRVCSDTPDPILHHRRDLPDALGAIVGKAMARDPGERFASAREFANALRDVEPATHSEGKGSSPVHSSETLPALSSAGNARVGERAEGSGRTSGKTERADPSRTRIQLGAAVALLCLPIAGAWMWSRETERTSPPALTRSVEPLPSTAVPAVSNAPIAEPQPVVVNTRRVSFEIVPSGTRIEVDGRLLCESPCQPELNEAPITLSFSRAGYRSETREFVPPFPERLNLALRRIRPSAPVSEVPELLPR